MLPTTPAAPERLEQVTIDSIPTDTLYRLEKPLSVGTEIIGDPQDYLIVHDFARFPIEERYMFEESHGLLPALAFAMIHTGTIVRIALINPQPQGYSSKVGILPNHITASIAPTMVISARYLPVDRDLVLASDHFRHSLQRAPYVQALPDQPFGGPRMTRTHYMRKGQLIRLERSDQLMIHTVRGCIKEAFTLNPESEMNVFIPEAETHFAPTHGDN